MFFFYIYTLYEIFFFINIIQLGMHNKKILVYIYIFFYPTVKV